MVERMYKKCLVVGIIILFIGAGVQSVFAFNTNISSNENNTSDNGFFNKLIMPDSYHDVGIKNITSPSNPYNTPEIFKPISLPIPEVYIQPGTYHIEVIVENNGTFPEYGLTCYAEIWEYITDPENGSLIYEDNITDIDLEEPMGGTETLNFKAFTFAYEGIYDLYIDLPLEIDDFPENNHEELIIGVDDTPPFSWIEEMDPPDPDGGNGWYVSDLKIIICAEDPNIAPGIPGSGICGDDCITFIIDQDGNGALVEWRFCDCVGNCEAHGTFTVNMDQTKPSIDLIYEVVEGNPIQGWLLRFTATATDATSGMDRVEFYLNDEWQDTIIGYGPEYEWDFRYQGGLNLVITAIGYDIAGNSAFDEIGCRNRDIVFKQSIYTLFFRLLDRFPLLQKLLVL